MVPNMWAYAWQTAVMAFAKIMLAYLLIRQAVVFVDLED